MRTFIGVLVGVLGVILILAGGSGSAQQLWTSLFGKAPDTDSKLPTVGGANPSTGSTSGTKILDGPAAGTPNYHQGNPSQNGQTQKF